MSTELTAIVRPLADLEATIERGLGTFVEVGQALLEIREHRLYRETHDSFETYCRDRWSFSRSRAHRLIEAAELGSMLPTGNIPDNERQARELARLKDDPEAVREVWAEVQEQTNGRPTAAVTRDIVDRHLGVPKPTPSTHRPPPRHEPEPDVETGGLCFECRQPIPVDVDECPSCVSIPALPEPEPISLDALADERDDDGAIARARLLSQYSGGIAAACKLGFLDAAAVVAVLSRERRPIHRENARMLRVWLDAVDRELDRAESRPLQVVGGMRG